MNDLTQYSNEIHKSARKIFPRRQVSTFEPNEIWSVDLVDMSNISEDNDNVKFLLNIVDIYSRYAYSFPLKSKKGSQILDVFKTLKILPKNIWVDQGSEFYNKDFKKFCKDHDINMYHTYSGLKSVYVERFNRTLKEMMYKYFTEHNSDYYLNVLDEFIKTYNNTVHSRTKVKPVDAYNEKKNPTMNIKSYNKIAPKFTIGDYVRISRVKQTFEKGYTARWSKEVFEIYKVDTSNYPYMYEIKDLLNEDIKGKFYEYELQPTALKDFAVVEKILQTKTVKGKKMYFVKYDGYDSKFNEWLNQNQLDNIT
jgi:hypothetical protein